MNVLQLGEYAENAATGIDVYSVIQPLGVCGGITAFNSPVMLACWLFPAPVSAGKTSVLTPSVHDPSQALMVAVPTLAAGSTTGVHNVLPGGPHTDNGLFDHTDIKALSFFG